MSMPDRGGAKPVNVSAYKVGQVVNAVAAKWETKLTTPPERFTEETLLTAMLNAWRYAKTDEDRKVLKMVEGLGTSRTRIQVIAGAITRGFFTSTKKGKKNELVSSPMARQMMKALQPELKDVAQTSKWELAFKMIEDGKVPLAPVIDKAYISVNQVVDYAKTQRGQIKLQMPNSVSQPTRFPSAGRAPTKTPAKAAAAAGSSAGSSGARRS